MVSETLSPLDAELESALAKDLTWQLQNLIWYGCLAHKNRSPAFSLRMHGHTSVGTSRYRWQDPKACPTHRRRSPMGSLNDA